jgi:hypothetical protein
MDRLYGLQAPKSDHNVNPSEVLREDQRQEDCLACRVVGTYISQYIQRLHFLSILTSEQHRHWSLRWPRSLQLDHRHAPSTPESRQNNQERVEVWHQVKTIRFGYHVSKPDWLGSVQMGQLGGSCRDLPHPCPFDFLPSGRPPYILDESRFAE